MPEYGHCAPSPKYTSSPSTNYHTPETCTPTDPAPYSSVQYLQLHRSWTQGTRRVCKDVKGNHTSIRLVNVVSSLVTPTVRRNSPVSSPHYSHQSNTCRASSIPPPPPTRPQPTNKALCLTTEEHQQHYPHLTPSPTDLYMFFPPRVRQNTDTTAHHCFYLRHRSVDSNSTNALQCAWITSWCNSLRYAPLLLLQTTTSPKHALLSTLPLTRSSVQYLQLHRSWTQGTRRGCEDVKGNCTSIRLVILFHAYTIIYYSLSTLMITPPITNHIAMLLYPLHLA